MDENEKIKFNLGQFQRHRKSYSYLIRIGIYVIILIVLTLLLRNKFTQSASKEDLNNSNGIEVDILE